MDELTFLLILAGIGVVLLVAMFTYYKHHKKIHDEIKDFNHHTHEMDDVLLKGFNNQEKQTGLSDSRKKDPLFAHQSLNDTDLPDSFSASKQDPIDIDQINFSHDLKTNDKSLAKGELVDGVYINSKRVISNQETTGGNPTSVNKTTSTFDTNVQSAQQEIDLSDVNQAFEQTSSIPTHDHEDSQGEISSFAMNDVPAETKTASSQQHSQLISVIYDPVPEGVEELIISHSILAKENYFTGQRLYDVIQAAGLVFGEMNIFHYPGNDKPETFALFSIANVVEPGVFHLEDADSFTTPGISMFMRLPTRMPGLDAYDRFIATAQYLASELDGELCDESRSLLTQQTISYKKEQIRELNFNITKAEKLAGTN